MSFKPKSKAQEYMESGNDIIYRCYSPNNPHYYEDITGSLHSIDLSHSQSLSNEKIGNFVLKSKNVQSFGIRSGSNNKYKYIGLRPDNTQENGSQQYEWSIVSASINNRDIPIDLSKYNNIDNVTVDLGNVVVRSNRQSTKQMFQYTGSINDFNIEYKLYLTGLHISNSKYTETKTLRNSISESLIDCGNIVGNQYSSMMELQTHSESILSMYFTDEVILKNTLFNPNPYYDYNNTGMQKQSGSEFTVDTGSFHIIDRDTDYWGYHSSWDYMSSGYLKDNLYLSFKDITLANKIKDHILELTDSEIDGNYIRKKGGKKVGAYIYPPDENRAYLLLALRDITHMSSSFRYKNFDDTSHITMPYSDIISSIRTQLNTYDSLTTSTNYYEPNDKNRFVITDNDGNYKYLIQPPVLLDSDFEEITNDTLHTLKDNGDGTYEYIKYPSKNLILGGISNDVNYIDSLTTHTMYPDSDVYTRSKPMNVGPSHTTARNDASVDVIGGTTIRMTHTVQLLKGSYGYTYYRGFMMFDISSIWTPHVYEGKLTVTSNGSYGDMTPRADGGKHLIAICSSSAGSSVSTSEGQAFDRNVRYMVDDHYSSFGRGVYFNSGSNETTDITLNNTALSNLKYENRFDVSVQEGAADFHGATYNGAYTGGSNPYSYGIQIYSEDYTGTSRDPVLEFKVRRFGSLSTIKSGKLKLKGGKFKLFGK